MMGFRTVYFIITHSCNQNCRYCYYSSGSLKLENQGNFPFGEAKSLFKNLKKWGFVEISFTGGEPCLHPNLGDFINMASHIGFKTTLCTNGSLLNLQKILRLKAKGLNNIYFSIDSLEENFHNKNRQNFKHTLQALKFALKIKFDLIGINVSITQQNYNTLDDLSQFCYSHHMDMNICPAWIPESSPLYPEINLNKSQEKELLAITSKWITRYGTDYYFRLTQNLLEPPEIPNKCQSATNDLVIYPNGDMFACFYDRNHLMGNFFKDSFPKILQNRDTFLNTLEAKNCCKKYCLNLVFE